MKGFWIMEKVKAVLVEVLGHRWTLIIANMKYEDGCS